MKITKWHGLVTATSPYLVPPGGAVSQINVTSLTPGQLTVRGGMASVATLPARALELYAYSPGSGKGEVILAYQSPGTIGTVRGLGGTVQVTEEYGGLLPDTPTTFASGRRGEVYVFQGYGQRPIAIHGGGSYFKPIGMDPPDSAPIVTVEGGDAPEGYVARIDVTDVGAGYADPPTVTIAAPPPGGRQATANARITDGRVSAVTVTDGGAGYIRSPGVVFSDPKDTPSAGKDAEAELSLVPEFPITDHNAGVVYWDFYLEGAPLGIFQLDDPDDPDNSGGWGYTLCYTLPPRTDGSAPARNFKYWQGGLVIPACGGTGQGAEMWLPLTDYGKRMLSWIYPTLDPNDPSNLPNYFPNPCNEDFPPFCSFTDEQMQDVVYGMPSALGAMFGYPQVFNFGEGYDPNDPLNAEIYAYLPTSLFHQVKSSNGGWSANILLSYCGLAGMGACPYVFKGYVRHMKDTPPDVTVKAASPKRQRPLSPTVKNPGSGYVLPPEFICDDGTIIKTEIDYITGSITKLIVDDPERLYLWAPEVVDSSGGLVTAKGVAVMRANTRGKYQCYYRWVDERVSEDDGGPLYSSLSPVTEVDVGDGATALIWNIPPLPSHATSVDIFRTTANQATTVFRVARLGGSADYAEPFSTSYRDTLSDWDLTNSDRPEFLAIAITLSDGSINANKYGVPSSDFAVGQVFQDRLWLGVDTTGKRPNTLMYSEADLPESVPDVNELILQQNLRMADHITALVPFAAALLVFQSKHCHRLTYVENPQIDGAVSLLAYRGCLNQRCWDLYEGSLYVLDDLGIYKMSENGQVESCSTFLDDLFRGNTQERFEIDFNKRKWFLLRADRNQKVIRVHVAFKGDEGNYPTRQLVFSIEHENWWVESYPQVFTSGTEVRLESGQIIPIVGGETDLYRLADGLTDEGAPIPFSWRSGNFEFLTDADRNGGSANPRNVTVTYQPTKESSALGLSLYYNGSSTARSNVAKRDRGVGFVAQQDSPESTLDMQLNQHGGDAPAIASALFSSRTLRDIYGSDRFVSVELSGFQTDAGAVILHELEVEGVAEKLA